MRKQTSLHIQTFVCVCVCEMIIKTAKTRSTLEHINYNSLTDRKIIFPVYFTQFCSTYIIPYILNDTSIPLYSDTEEWEEQKKNDEVTSNLYESTRTNH